jgi:hypothetical protein
MASRRFRAPNLSNRDEVGAGYNRRIYYCHAYLLYTLLSQTRSAQFKSFSEIFLSLLALSPAERILNRLSFLKIDSAVRLRFLFRPQTTNIFGLSVIVAVSLNWHNGWVYETFGISKRFPINPLLCLLNVLPLKLALSAKCFIYRVRCWALFIFSQLRSLYALIFVLSGSAIFLCVWAGILFGKFWFALWLVQLANVYDCEARSKLFISKQVIILFFYRLMKFNNSRNFFF